MTSSSTGFLWMICLLSPTSDHLKEEFMALFSADFDVTGGDLMQSFLGLEVEQLDGFIKLHLDTYNDCPPTPSYRNSNAR